MIILIIRYDMFALAGDKHQILIKVTPISDVLGVAITGVDLSKELGSEVVSSIKQAWIYNIIIAFPSLSFHCAPFQKNANRENRIGQDIR
tara:strand:+ start:3739 stop:4008 length:270 start_codon:yes stop_codon:yes gene_type:complete